MSVKAYLQSPHLQIFFLLFDADSINVDHALPTESINICNYKVHNMTEHTTWIKATRCGRRLKRRHAACPYNTRFFTALALCVRCTRDAAQSYTDRCYMYKDEPVREIYRTKIKNTLNPLERATGYPLKRVRVTYHTPF